MDRLRYRGAGKLLPSLRERIPIVAARPKKTPRPTFARTGHPGILCTGESYKKVVKLTFAKGASLLDPARLFNSSLEGNVRRAIDLHEGETVDESAFKALLRQAVAFNRSAQSKPSKKAKS